jgi:hypothetical protein
LIESIYSAEEAGDDDKLEGLICGAVRYLKLNRAKPETTMYLSLMYLAKTKQALFDSDIVIEVSEKKHNNTLIVHYCLVSHSNFSKVKMLACF